MIQDLARTLADAVASRRSDFPSLCARERSQLEAEIGPLTSLIVGVPGADVLQAMIAEIAATIHTIEREIDFLEKRRAGLEEEIRVRCAAAVSDLSRTIERELARRQSSLVAAELETIQASYQTELSAAAGTGPMTAARFRGQLPRLIEVSRSIRARAEELARGASNELMRIDMQTAAHVVSARREVHDRIHTLLQRLAEHADQDELPIVNSIQESRAEMFAAFRKHLLIPLLDDLRYERRHRLAGKDPLQPLVQSLQRSVR